MRTIEKLYQKATQQQEKHHEKRGLVCGDGAGGWLCQIAEIMKEQTIFSKQTFPTKEAAIEWGGNQIEENHGYLIIFDF